MFFMRIKTLPFLCLFAYMRFCAQLRCHDFNLIYESSHLLLVPGKTLDVDTENKVLASYYLFVYTY